MEEKSSKSMNILGIVAVILFFAVLICLTQVNEDTVAIENTSIENVSENSSLIEEYAEAENVSITFPDETYTFNNNTNISKEELINSSE